MLTYMEVLEKAVLLEYPEIYVYLRDGIEYKEITLINDGNAQKPFGELSQETFDQLQEKNKLGKNILIGFRGNKCYPVLKWNQ